MSAGREGDGDGTPCRERYSAGLIVFMISLILLDLWSDGREFRSAVVDGIIV